MSEPDFSGRVVIVTGAGKGIGQACALAFARMGATVVISGRSREPLEETRGQIAGLGANCAIYEGDVADQNTAQGTVALALSEFGRLDFAVNNAGISPWVGTTAECSIEAWQQVISINLTGTWMGMKYQIPALLQSGGGAIVNVSSVAALSTLPDTARTPLASGGSSASPASRRANTQARASESTRSRRARSTRRGSPMSSPARRTRARITRPPRR